jgi:hypothetical protein
MPGTGLGAGLITTTTYTKHLVQRSLATTCRQNNREKSRKSQTRDEGGTHNLEIVMVSTHLTPALPLEPCGQWITMSPRSKRRLLMAEDEEHAIQGTQALS